MGQQIVPGFLLGAMASNELMLNLTVVDTSGDLLCFEGYSSWE